ncbi:MAG: hypothetical protein ACKVW3_01560 [Phycisphaerales bacterium]
MPSFLPNKSSGSIAVFLMLVGGTSSALAQAGGLAAWGDDEKGGTTGLPCQGNLAYASLPHGAFVHTSAGHESSLAVRVTGQVVGWGGDRACFFGVFPLPSFPTIPNHQIVKAFAGYDHAFVLYSDGTAFGWGMNDKGQSGPCPSNCPMPCPCIPFPGGKFRSISAGEWINIGIRLDSDPDLDWTVVVWGANPTGQFALTPPDAFNSALPGVDARKVKQAICGGHHVAVLDFEGNITTWGYYQYGANPTTIYHGPNYRNLNPQNLVDGVKPYSPGYVPGAYGAIAAGHHFDAGFVKDSQGNLTGEVHVWGNPANGVLELPDGSGELYVEISGGYYTGMGLKRSTGGINNGKIQHWDNPLPAGMYNTGVAFPFPPTDANRYWELGPANTAFHHTALVGCYANCDNSTTLPILDANDLLCFNTEFACASGDCANTPQTLEAQIRHYCNCDGSTTAPIFTANDLLCFNMAFVAGCKDGRPVRPY